MKEFWKFIKNHILSVTVVFIMLVLTLMGYAISVITLAREEEPDVASYVNQHVFAGVAIHNIKEGLIGPDGVLIELDNMLLHSLAKDTAIFEDGRRDNNKPAIEVPIANYDEIYKEHKKIEPSDKKDTSKKKPKTEAKAERENDDNLNETDNFFADEPQDEEAVIDNNGNEITPLIPCEADNNYFMDALFLGDSRVVGLGAFSNLPNITVYALKAFQIYTLEDKAIIDTALGPITIPQALLMQQGKYKKVYMKFGLNEMGMDEAKFDEYYYHLIDLVKYTQPDAAIYVQGLIHVSVAKDADASVITNERIDKRNEHLRQIAEEEGVIFLDLNEVFTNENNALSDEYASDGVHLKAQYINIWIDYLKKHAYKRKSWGKIKADREYTGDDFPYVMNYFMPDGSSNENVVEIDEDGNEINTQSAVMEDGEVVTVKGGSIEAIGE